MSAVNRSVRLVSRPVGIPEAHHFAIRSAPVPPLADGELLVRNHYLAVEPAMRGWVNAAANYAEPVAIGAVMRAFAAGEVVASRHPGYAVGDRVVGMLGWQELAVSDGSSIERKVDPASSLPLSTALGVLGLNGFTAYFGLLEVGQPKAGETVVVSTAAGAVGSCVGQIALIEGCRAVGIAGGPVKAALCTDAFGFDAALDYKSEADLGAALARACPKGIDVYFDNTSGRITDAVLPLLNVGARVVICGTASIASWDPVPHGPRVERHLLVKRARMQGILIFDWRHRFAEAEARLTQWIEQGRMQWREDVLDGLEAAPGSIAGLYRGENLGRRLIRLV